MRPIGVFDSGVGGLTVLAALRRRLPQRPLLYLGDTARLPYGTKSAETVRRYTRRNVEFLLDRQVEAVVVACNTASAVALGEGGVEADLDVPVWGVVEPGARRAAAASSGRIGVIGTTSTIRSDAYGRALRALRPELHVTSIACPLFVPLVEEGWHDDAIAEAVARRYLEPLREAAIDTLVLGCTHYPLLTPVIRRALGDAVTLVDSAEAVAETVAKALPDIPSATPPAHHICLTDAPDRFATLARQILGDPAPSLELVEIA